MSGRDDFKREEEDEADEVFDENNYKTQKDAVLFAIDVSSSMLERPPPSKSRKADQDSAISAALRCAYQIMQQRIIAQPKDLMGILLFGTEKSKFRAVGDAGDGDGDGDGDDSDGDSEIADRKSTYPHCYLFMDLDVPAAEDVRRLKDMIEEGEDPDEVLVPAPADQSVLMSNVLFAANQAFTTNAPNFGSRRLFIITDNDSPHVGDKMARSSAAVRAKDLYDLGVVIELFPVTRGDAPFDLAKFYDDIIYRDPDAEEGTSNHVAAARTGDGLTLLSSLVSNISAKQTPKRSYFSGLTFEVAPGLAISVKGYTLLNSQRPARTCYVWQDGEAPQLATSETVRVDADSTRTVAAGEVKKAYKFGGEYVYFSPEELKALKTWPFPDGWKGKGLRIVGFKPRALLPPWASVRRSTFIYPSEEDYVGSTRVFSALWSKLRASDKVGIAWFVPRTNANPLLVAMIPSGEVAEDEEAAAAAADTKGHSHSHTPATVMPAGLWLFPLPFAEDIRKFDDGRPPLRLQNTPALAELAERMKPIVENLFLPKMAYNPAKYPNPALQWHYKILQALALEEEVPEAAEDLTLPKYKAIDKRVGGSLAEFKEAVKEAAAKLQVTRAIKHDVDEEEEGRPLAKRPKTAAAAGAAAGTKGAAAGSTVTAKTLRSAVDNGKLSTMSVAMLREVLASRGQATTGRKAELVDRLEQWVETNL